MAAKRQRLAARRKAVGLTQEHLAERLGVERSTVVRSESGAAGKGTARNTRQDAAVAGHSCRQGTGRSTCDLWLDAELGPLINAKQA